MKLILSLALIFLLFGCSSPKTPSNFAECSALYPVMESYPAKCSTPDGKVFVQDIKEPIPNPPTQSGETTKVPQTSCQTLNAQIDGGVAKVNLPIGYALISNINSNQLTATATVYRTDGSQISKQALEMNRVVWLNSPEESATFIKLNSITSSSISVSVCSAKTGSTIRDPFSVNCPNGTYATYYAPLDSDNAYYKCEPPRKCSANSDCQYLYINYLPTRVGFCSNGICKASGGSGISITFE